MHRTYFFLYLLTGSVSRLHCEIGIYKAVYISVHDILDVAVFKAGTVVLCQRVRHKNIRADLAAPLYLLLNALNVAYLFKVLALLDLGKTRAQHIAAVLEVLEVASLDRKSVV